MNAREVARLLSAQVLAGEDRLDDTPILSACGADLMSDVLAFVKHDTVLLTGLTNPHVVRTVEMLDVRCLVFVRGKLPSRDILDQAEEKGLVVMATPDTLYVACGKLYAAGLPGGQAW